MISCTIDQQHRSTLRARYTKTNCCPRQCQAKRCHPCRTTILIQPFDSATAIYDPIRTHPRRLPRSWQGSLPPAQRLLVNPATQTAKLCRSIIDAQDTAARPPIPPANRELSVIRSARVAQEIVRPNPRSAWTTWHVSNETAILQQQRRKPRISHQPQSAFLDPACDHRRRLTRHTCRP